jgi:hypothetical protein
LSVTLSGASNVHRTQPGTKRWTRAIPLPGDQNVDESSGSKTRPHSGHRGASSHSNAYRHSRHLAPDGTFTIGSYVTDSADFSRPGLSTSLCGSILPRTVQCPFLTEVEPHS